MGIIDNPEQRNYLEDPYNGYDGKIAIELRGSSSAAYPKKQYRFETQDSLGNNLNVSLLGLPSENDWIFYGPYDDQSLIRNALAYKISNEMGRYASRTHFCELILNDEYQGLYVLVENIKRDKNRVDIAKLTEIDIEGDQLTGGYIIKIDKIEGESTEHWSSPLGTSYQYHYPKFSDIQQEQIDYIQNFIAGFENIMNSPDYNNHESGYHIYINTHSFVDHFIINEYAKNVDAYRISAFLYKDKDSKNGKLNAGPAWDFNLSFGKAWFAEDLFLTQGWQVYYNSWRPWDGFKVPFWWEKLVQDYKFESELVNRWQELRQDVLSTDNIFSIIDSLVAEIDEARERNFLRWPEAADEHTYEFEILQLKSWIIARTQWIDENLDLLTSLNLKKYSNPAGFKLSQNYPNPFNHETIINYELNSPDFVTLKVYDINGRETITLIEDNQNAGGHSFRFDAVNLASGIYFYRLATSSGFSENRKMILLK